jgi:hypothetical protein
MKRLIVAVVIFIVIVVMALRGCPKVRRSAGMAYDSTTVAQTEFQEHGEWRRSIVTRPLLSQGIASG